MNGTTRSLLVIALACVVPVPLQAQAARALVGFVKDSAGRAIASAEVRTRTDGVIAHTDDAGRFHVAEMPAGARGVMVRRLGFAPSGARIMVASGNTDSVEVVLAVVVATLPSVAAMSHHDSLSRRILSGFWSRRDRGFGKFITRDEIDRRGAARFTDIMRVLPSVRVMSQAGRSEIRFGQTLMRDCPPKYWLDGIPLESGSADEFPPDNVEAIEVYSSAATTPPQFSTRSRTCGTIVIWSRLPG